MNNWNCFLKWVITYEFAWWRLLVLNQWAVKGGVRKFLCSFLGAYSNDGVATERRAAGWQQLLWMWHKPFSCVSGHSPGTLCQVNCCPQTAVGVMGQYPWDLSVGKMGHISLGFICGCTGVCLLSVLVSMCPCVLGCAEFIPETPFGCATNPCIYPSFKPVNKYLHCWQIQNLEWALQFVQQFPALRVFWVVCK